MGLLFISYHNVMEKKIIDNLFISSLFQKGILLWMIITMGSQLLASIYFHRKILYIFSDLNQYEMLSWTKQVKSLVNSILEIQFCNPSEFLKGSGEVWPLFALIKSPILKFLTKKRGGTYLGGKKC